MEDAMASTQSEVRALLESWSEAAGMKDIDRLMSLYSPDIVYFDVVPPLQYTGSAAVRENFLRWFESFKSSIGQEIRDSHILTSGDLAAAYMLSRLALGEGQAELEAEPQGLDHEIELFGAPEHPLQGCDCVPVALAASEHSRRLVVPEGN
jgi:ketosteroid isomerase-like protein